MASHGRRPAIRKILCALDGSEHAEKALALAADLAAKYRAELILLHGLSDGRLSAAERALARTEFRDEVLRAARGTEPGRSGEVAEAAIDRVLDDSERFGHRLREHLARGLLQRGEHEARARGVDEVATIMHSGEPASTILDHARHRGVDTVVLGSRGLGGVQGLVMGSVAQKLMHEAPCTVVAVR